MKGAHLQDMVLAEYQLGRSYRAAAKRLLAAGCPWDAAVDEEVAREKLDNAHRLRDRLRALNGLPPKGPGWCGGCGGRLPSGHKRAPGFCVGCSMARGLIPLELVMEAPPAGLRIRVTP